MTAIDTSSLENDTDIFLWDTDRKLNELADSGVATAAALDLLGSLLHESSTASKTKIEQIKLMDKLLNTCRAFIETRIKTEEILAITGKLDELERRMDTFRVKLP